MEFVGSAIAACSEFCGLSVPAFLVLVLIVIIVIRG
jgi:hypothetical protein